MEFTFIFEGITYNIYKDDLHNTFLVESNNTSHKIGKHSKGHWVALEHKSLSAPIPLKEIGAEIDKRNLI